MILVAAESQRDRDKTPYDHSRIAARKGVGISGGGNVLLHMATRQPDHVAAMALVSTAPYFPAQARSIMRQYASSVSDQDWERLRRRHPGGDAQISALLSSTAAFADSYDDRNFTWPYLATIPPRMCDVKGDREPLYPVEISVEMAKAIPRSTL